MLERLRQCRVVLLLIAVLVMVIRLGGLHAHVDVPTSLESGLGTQAHFNTSIFDADDDHGHEHQDDAGHIDVESVSLVDRDDGRAALDLDSILIVGILALVLATYRSPRLRPSSRTPQGCSKPVHLRPLLRGPPSHSVT